MTKQIDTLLAWQNGEFTQLKNIKISILDLWFIHCDATYDVMHAKDKKIFKLGDHLKRLRKSCEGWRLPLNYTDLELTKVINTLLEQGEQKDLLVWIWITRGIPESWNPRDLQNCKGNVFIYVKPYFGFKEQNTATLCLAKTVVRVSDRSINQLYKNFAWNDLTKAQWEAIDRGFDTAILLNQDWCITEGPWFNVGFIKWNSVYAPKSNRLEWITMKVLSDICWENNIPFLWGDIKWEDVYLFDALFLTSTAGDIIEITQFENTVYDRNSLLCHLQVLFKQEYEKEKEN